MAARSPNFLMSSLESIVRLHPRLSAGLAFELGVIVGQFVKTARGRRGLKGATAKLIEGVPLISQSAPARPAKRKSAARRRPVKRKAA